jgi:hypothetical protein
MSFPLLLSKNRVARPGDFSASVRGNAIEAPEEVYDAARKLSLHDAVQLISFLYSFPSAFAAEMGWTIDDVLRARDRLTDLLRGRIPDALLKPTVVKRTYGAFPPAGKH